MKQLTSGLPPNIRATALTVGTFDGVHRGHLDVIHRLVTRATIEGVHSVAVTFSPHPLEIVNPSIAPQLLTTTDEKIEVLAETGLDYLVILPFTQTLSERSAESFVDDVLRDMFRMRILFVGHDHGFGHHRAGNANVLQALGATRGFEVEVISPVAGSDGEFVSSTAIRRAVAAGDVARAGALLGRPYSMSGTVVRGDQRGRTIGYPTINLSTPAPRKLLPADGVYAGRVQTPLGAFGAMMSIGPRPTFNDETRLIEAHLFDMSGDLYDAPVRIDVLARLRDIKRFDNVNALVSQMRADEIMSRFLLMAKR